jgi:hypothetical protein
MLGCRTQPNLNSAIDHNRTLKTKTKRRLFDNSASHIATFPSVLPSPPTLITDAVFFLKNPPPPSRKKTANYGWVRNFKGDSVNFTSRVPLLVFPNSFPSVSLYAKQETITVDQLRLNTCKMKPTTRHRIRSYIYSDSSYKLRMCLIYSRQWDWWTFTQQILEL